ncbi:DUF4221 family protein [Chitinophaga arvensicola]|uniref:DUF4221 domain-containing protein n=1 Tax=Chitinophaga arvensicola TaxID=29529 RepID=A0A1I0R8R2_9BACT|nr:DUF4221 family protein [Chitinophaga arvensicola]SEW37187.1 protein of unknown function [Chitinophaga arvensicola]
MKKLLCICLAGLCFACSNNNASVEIRNEKKGTLKGTQTLQMVEEKKFPLDSLSAPRPQFVQLYMDSIGNERLAVLNTYDKSIHLYDYGASASVGNINIGKTHIPLAFHIKNQDSVFVYDDQMLELVLMSRQSDSLTKFSLIGNSNIKELTWTYQYPQYVPHSVNEIMELSGNIFFPGQYIWSIPDSLVSKFKFASLVDFKNKDVRFMHQYPAELYGKGYMWDEPVFNSPYYDLTPAADKLVYSFPVSHNLYIYDLKTDSITTVYGGSNVAGDITSMDKAKFSKSAIPREYIYNKACTVDLYSGIKYDKYRNVYYRFLRKALPESGARLRMENKKLIVIIMDKDFHYLGESELGDMNAFFPDNSFVTKEGLNIEYVDPADVQEKYLAFKIFQPKNI